MATKIDDQQKPVLKANLNQPSELDINILLLGQTGTGKSTFINALANYIVYDTLEEAAGNEMQMIIPSSFYYTDLENFEGKLIQVGNENSQKRPTDIGQPCTQCCRSFVFPVGGRNLRLIDTPGIGDIRGLGQDVENFQEILTYIAQYEHMNGICIFLRPNEERLNIPFRLYINELLRHLGVSASENLLFMFNDHRRAFSSPSISAKGLRVLFDQYRETNNISVPFSRNNAFLLDNETYRYLALRHSNIQLDHDQTKHFSDNWNHSVKECTRFIEYIATRPLHAVSNTLSLNEAKLLVRKLARPIAETVKLIVGNIQLANKHKRSVIDDPQSATQGMPQMIPRIEQFSQPKMICINENCRQLTEKDQDRIICHKKCPLPCIIQDLIRHLNLENCPKMNPQSGNYETCNCSWNEHMHITYDYLTDLIYPDWSKVPLEDGNKQTVLVKIDKYIDDLRNEETQIHDICTKLSKFLHANTMIPINDHFIKHLRFFLRVERRKRDVDEDNAEVVACLEKTVTDFMDEMNLLKKTWKEHVEPANTTETLQLEDIFTLAGTLYRLPNTGRHIRQQIDIMTANQKKIGSESEHYVELPMRAVGSSLMLHLKDILSSR